MNTPVTYAFTTYNDGLATQLKNSVTACYGEKAVNALALWDTGATTTCISSKVVDDLGLVPTGKMNIKTPSGETQVNTYLIDIILPNKVRMASVDVCDSEIGNQGIDVLIGMNIILMGDFAVSNYNGKTVFTFRYPSRETTDYAKEVNIENLRGPIHGKGKRKK